jgi:hypothetical protein
VVQQLDDVFNQDKIVLKNRLFAARCNGPSGQKYVTAILKVCGPGSSVGVATGCELDGPGIDSRLG